MPPADAAPPPLADGPAETGAPGAAHGPAVAGPAAGAHGPLAADGAEQAAQDAAAAGATAAGQAGASPGTAVATDWAEGRPGLGAAAAPSVAPAPAPPTGRGGTVDAAGACRALGVAPDTFRRLLAEYGDLVGAGAPRGGDGIPVTALGALAAAQRWSCEGLPRDEVRRRLAALGSPAFEAGGSGAAEAAAGASPPDLQATLLAEVHRLHATLARSEERRAEDRDRLLTALLRTHQELQSLRVVVSPRSRRRRRSLWTRLFG